MLLAPSFVVLRDLRGSQVFDILSSEGSLTKQLTYTHAERLCVSPSFQNQIANAASLLPSKVVITI
jgi:hypothetical protein